MAAMLDTVRAVETPEGVEIGLRLAGPVPRFLAWSIDLALRAGVYILLSIPLSLLGQSGLGILLVALFLLEWFYPVLFEVLRGGATPGKKGMGLIVLHRDGTPVGWTASLVRNLVRFVDFLPLCYGFGLASMLADREFRRLGDFAAGTVVVHKDAEGVGSRVPEAPPLRPALPLSRDEQRAVIDFAERLPTWSEQRARELARLARPLTSASGGTVGAAGTGGTAGTIGAAGSGGEEVGRLLGIANWLLGRR